MAFPVYVNIRKLTPAARPMDHAPRDSETKSWKTSSQNSILFEIDGPYKVRDHQKNPRVRIDK